MTGPVGRPGGLACDEARELAAGFVLGSLEPVEVAAVREHLATCTEPHPEFGELGGAAAALLETPEPVEPRAGLRDRILAAAAADDAPRAEAGATAGPGPVSVAPIAPAGVRVASLDEARERRRSRTVTWVLAAAAAIAIVALATLSFQLRSGLDDSERYADAVAAVLEVAAEPGSAATVLQAPTGGGPSGFGAIAPDGSVAIAMRGLQPTSGREVYEAWVIRGESAPVPIGGFTVGGDGTGFLASGEGSGGTDVTLALTLEPGPGATVPTMPIVSLGTTTSG